MSFVEGLQQAGPYQIAERLGSNGVAATFRATEIHRGDAACVVALAESDLEKSGAWAEFQKVFNLLVINPKPKLIKPLQCGQMTGLCWAAYEFLEGIHLGEAVRDSGLPSAGQALQISLHILEALQVLHEGGMTHGAMTPASVFLTTDNDVLLHHVGWSSLILGITGGAKNGAFVSNLPFLAPEVVEGGAVSPASDLYSLGANLYFLLAGRPLFWGEDIEDIAEAIVTGEPDFGPLADLVPDDVVALVGNLLEKNPADRPPDHAALVSRLGMLVERHLEEEAGATTVANEEAQPEPSAPPILPPNASPEAAPPPAGLPDVPPPPSSAPPPAPPPAATVPSQAHPDVAVLPPPPALPPAPPEQVAEPLPPPPKSQTPPDTKGAETVGAKLTTRTRKPPNRKLLLIAGAAILLVCLAGGLLAILGSLSGGEEEPGAAPARNGARPGKSVASGPIAQEKINGTLATLEKLGERHRQYIIDNGLWARRVDQLVEAGAPEAVTRDAWGKKLDIRESYIVSAGPDGHWNTQDEIWIDAETGITGP